jgi:hypothetical protein
MLDTEISFSFLARSNKDMCPRCKAPMVGTKPIVFSSFLRFARQSLVSFIVENISKEKEELFWISQ